MLSVQTIQILVTGVVTGVVLGALGGITYCRKKGINIDKNIDNFNTVVNAAKPIVGVADALLPGNPAVAVLKTIEGWAKIAAGNAEELKHAGDINGDQRAATAEKVVNAVLKELNVEATDNRKILIDAAIRDTVGSFGHKEPTEAEQQAAMDKVKEENTKLAAENANLKAAITQFNANTASTVQPVTNTTVRATAQ